MCVRLRFRALEAAFRACTRWNGLVVSGLVDLVAIYVTRDRLPRIPVPHRRLAVLHHLKSRHSGLAEAA